MLEKFCKAKGVSGFEKEIRELFIKEIEKYVSEVEIDKLGNVIARRGEGEPKVMIAAHMDEIGLVVKKIDKNGFVYFAKIGGIYDGILPGTKVVAYHENGEYEGVIGIKPPHLMKNEERKKLISHEDLFIDFGFQSEEEAKNEGFRPGVPIVFKPEFITMPNGMVSCKAMDDRSGLVSLVYLAKSLKDFEGTIYFVGTVQEEVGLKGAKTVAFRLKPDLAIAVDVTIAGPSPGLRERDYNVEINKGPVITILEASGRGLIADRIINEWLERGAKENDIPYQIEVLERGATDAAEIYITGEGIPSTALSIPARYIHTPSEVISIKDLENLVKLLKVSIESGLPTFWRI